MANSGTESVTVAGGAFTLGYNYTAYQNQTANTSTITVTLWWRSNKSWATMNDATASNWSITIGESSWAKSTSGTANSSVGAYGTKTIGTFTATIAHYSDGTLQIPIRCSHTVDITWSGSYIGNVSVGTGKWTLPQISRLSTFKMNVSKGFVGETNVTFTVTENNSGYTTRLYWAWNKDGTGVKGTDWEWISSNASSGTLNWTISEAIGKKMVNSWQTWIYIYIDTLNGTQSLGSSWQRLDVEIGKKYAPAISTFTITEGNSKAALVAENATTFIQNISEFKLAGAATGKLDATIEKYEWKIGSSTGSGASATIKQVADTGTVPVTLTVYDSRGWYASQTKNVTIKPYKAPSIAATATRTTEAGTTISVNRTISATVFGAKNIYTTFIKIRERGGTYGIELNKKTGTNTFTDTVSLTGTYDAKKTWEVYIEASDTFGTVTSQVITVAPLTAVVYMSDKGVGINKEHSQGALDVAGDIYSSGKVVMKSGTINGKPIATNVQETVVLNATTFNSAPYPRETNTYNLGATAGIVGIGLTWRLVNDSKNGFGAWHQTTYIPYSAVVLNNAHTILLPYSMSAGEKPVDLTGKNVVFAVSGGNLSMQGSKYNYGTYPSWWVLQKIVVFRTV